MGTSKSRGNVVIFRSGFFSMMMFVWFLSLLAQGTCFASTVTLQWDPVAGSDVAGYKLHYKADSPVAPLDGAGAVQGDSPVDVANQNTATLSGLDPAHAYYFAVTAYNSAGIESPYSNLAFLAESTPPTASITYPSNGATVSATVSVTASATDNVGVTRVEFYVNGVLQSSDTASPYLYSWNTTALPSGTYTVFVKAFDAAGNVGQSPSLTVSVVNDSAAPAVSLSAPANNATLSGTVALTASASDNVGVTRVEFYQNGALLSASNVVPYSFSWNSATVPNGAYTLSARAYDAAGNVGQSAGVSVKVANNTTLPAVSLAAPLNNSTLGGTVSLAANANDDIGIARVEFYLNGSLLGSSTSAPFKFNWNTASVANGTYTLSARAYDTSGNAGQSTAVSVTVFNDTSAPLVAIASLTSTVAGTVAVDVGASDDEAVIKVEFYVNGALQSALTGAPYRFSWNTVSLANGSYLLSAKAYDAAGNVGVSAGEPVTVFNDRVAPQVSISQVSTPTSATAQTISGTVSDNSAQAGVTVRVGTGAAGTAQVVGSNWSFALTGLAEGANQVTVTATDGAGNSSTATATILVQAGTTPATSDPASSTPQPLTIVDAQTALQIASGKATASATQAQQLDVAPYINGKSCPNGKIDAGDVVVILSKLVGKL